MTLETTILEVLEACKIHRDALGTSYDGSHSVEDVRLGLIISCSKLEQARKDAHEIIKALQAIQTEADFKPGEMTSELGDRLLFISRIIHELMEK